ncbi:hypothetical protein [Parvularcula maris]|uniref:Uncharacterized protein n=1 Tax=Parvularcula maris TaxID=2965077 RepID=A0A9X2L8W3_9PROT|nr:hypothetical protein [Parvularcula maris]MCQ8185243.1 hypothetical protein [Parvularcula maris]
MAKRVVLFLLLTLAWSQDARAEVTLRAGYHAPADLFSLMDQTSLWWPGFNEPEYREAWEERFGWSDEDQRQAEAYADYRRRTYSDPAQGNRKERLAKDGIFTARSSVSRQADPLAEHFLGAQTIEEALSTLETIMGADDAHMLRGFYRHFQPHWRQLLEESKAFAKDAARLDAVLNSPGTPPYLERLAAFYRVDETLEFNALYVWWPPIDRTSADISGRTFFIRSHPTAHSGESWAEIAMHEAVHYLSAHQPSQQKVALTKRFLDRCPAKLIRPYDLLEEPLAVAWGNAAFAKYGLGQPLGAADSWYGRPLPSVMGRLLWLHVDELYETDATITDGLIDAAAAHCRELLELRGDLRPTEAGQ